MITFIFSLFFTFFYIKFAKYFELLAEINKRSLHKNKTPTGGGIVFSSIFNLTISYLLFFKGYFNDEIIFLLMGSILASIIGCIDDYFNIRASFKFFIQIILGCLSIFAIELTNLPYSHSINGSIFLFIVLFVLVWIMNVFNFIDGIDGLASAASVIISLTLAGVIFLEHGFSENIVLLLFVFIISVAFLIFNFPKAFVFMGDSGSLFLGFFFGFMAIRTIFLGELTIYNWMIISAYFISDTGITTFTRLIKVKKWYGEHRSHAYQNIAKKINNHKKVCH